VIPCIRNYPPGWDLDAAPIVRSGSGSFSLSSGVAGPNAVTVTLTARCEVVGATWVPDPAEGGTLHWQAYLGTPGLDQGHALLQYYSFPGGCVTYRYAFQPGTPGTAEVEMNSALTFVDRANVAAFVEAEFEQTLCGAGSGTACIP
jgi:hypothetical protein